VRNNSPMKMSMTNIYQLMLIWQLVCFLCWIPGVPNDFRNSFLTVFFVHLSYLRLVSCTKSHFKCEIPPSCLMRSGQSLMQISSLSLWSNVLGSYSHYLYPKFVIFLLFLGPFEDKISGHSSAYYRHCSVKLFFSIYSISHQNLASANHIKLLSDGPSNFRNSKYDICCFTGVLYMSSTTAETSLKCHIPSQLCVKYLQICDFSWLPLVQLQKAVTSLIIIQFAQTIACFKALAVKCWITPASINWAPM